MSRVVAWSSVGLAFALLVLGCSRRPSGDRVIEETPSLREPANAAKASDEDRAALARDNTRFALDLQRRFSGAGNPVTSPFAVPTVLAMSLARGRGQSGHRMKKTLRFSPGPDRLHPAFGALVWGLHGRGKMQGYSLRLANALW